MKSFIVVALLVASVAARSLDVDTLRLIKEKSLLNKEMKDDLLFNKETIGHRFQLPKKTILGDYPLSTSTDFTDFDTTTTGFEVPATTGQRQVNLLSLEEITQTSLFREYYNIPLFRQFWQQYPTVFQRYIQSVLFQQFWTVPAFQQYFRNPVFFYKYIVPQVQVVARTQSVDIFNKYDNFDYTNVADQYLNKNVFDDGKDVVDFNRIFNGLQGYNSEFTVPYARGYPYGQQFFGKNHMNNQVNYKFLLDKIYKTLFVNQPTGEITQVRTDVKIAPAHKNFVVEPVTGETKVVVEEPKIVDVKVVEKVIPRTEFEGQIIEGDFIKETLLKKYLLNNVITREVYEVLKTLPISQIEMYIRQHVGQEEFVQGDYLVKETLLKKLLVNNVITREVYEVLKTFPIYMIEKYVRVTLGQDQVIEGDYLVKDNLLKKYLLTNVINREVYEVLKTLPITMVEKYIREHVGQGEFVEGDYLVKETLLKKLYLNNVITRDVYEVLKTFPIHMIEKYIRITLGQDQVIEGDYLVKETLLKKYLLTKVISPEVYEILKTLPITMVEKYIRQHAEFFEGDYLVKETLLKKLYLNNVITRDVYETLKTFPIHMIEKYVRVILGQDQVIEGDYLVKETLLKKYLLTKVISPEVYEILKTLPITMVEKYILHIVGQQQIVGDYETPFVTGRDSRNIFGLDFPRTQFEGKNYEQELVKVTLLKKLLLTNVINRETYEILKTLPVYKVEKYIRQLVGEHQIVGDLETPFVTRRDTFNPFVTRGDFTSQIFNTNTFGQKTMYNPLYNQQYNNQIVGDRSVPTLRDLLNIRA